MLDHIFYNDSFELDSLLEMPSEKEFSSEVALPNSIYPSDHVRIEVKLQFKSNTDNSKEK
jgi:mRNA deadenylase 3'-5' endonuclease subunit Ccr4